MNILTFTTLWPNAEQPNFGVFVKHRIAALAKLDGIDVRVVAPIPFFPKISLLPRAALTRWQQFARIPERELIDGLPTFHPRYLVTPKLGMSFYGAWMAFGAWPTVERLHAEKPFDLIDAHYVYPDGYAAVRLGRKLNIPVVITARGTDINLFSRMPAIWPKIVNTLNRADGVIAVSNNLKQRMVELGIIGQKIAVIGNGIDREVFYPRNREEARRKLGFAAEDRIILTVAALAPVKGIDRLVDAMALLPKTERIKLFVIGEGAERKALESRISKLGLRDIVFLIGARPQVELPDRYSAADLFCLASHREGCPNVVLEAMACGLPVVATDVGGIRDMIGQGCGKTVADPTSENFAEEVTFALNFDWDRQKIAECGGTRSWADAVVEIFSYYSRRGIGRNFH